MKIFGKNLKRYQKSAGQENKKTFIEKVIIIRTPEDELDKLNKIEEALENISGHTIIIDRVEIRQYHKSPFIAGASYRTGHRIEQHLAEKREFNDVVTDLIKRCFE